MADKRYTDEEIRKYIDSINKKEKKVTIINNYQDGSYWGIPSNLIYHKIPFEDFYVTDTQKTVCRILAALASGVIPTAIVCCNLPMASYQGLLIIFGGLFPSAAITYGAGLVISSIITGVSTKISNAIYKKRKKKEEKNRKLQKEEQIEYEKIKNKEIQNDIEEYISMISKSIIDASSLKYDGCQEDINRLYRLAQTYMNMREANPNKSGADIIRENPKFMYALNDIESIINSHRKNQDSLIVEKQILSELSKQIPEVREEYTDELVEPDLTTNSDGATMELPKLNKRH